MKKQLKGRRIRVEFRKFADVKAHPDNPRTITKEALAGLGASIGKFGYVEPIVVNDQTGYVVGGHQRMKVMIAEGGEGADMVVVDMTPDDERQLLLALNNPHIQGTWTPELQRVLEQVHEMVDTDYDALQFAALERDAAALFASMSEPEEKEPQGTRKYGEDRYSVLAICEDERACKALYDELEGRGFECKVIT
jgi:ParB-like chromosome segregation protein Spo0J